MFWPDGPHTKGDLLRYYVRVSPYILPVVADRPLVMKRFPNGVGSDAFYQHRAPDKIPSGIRSISLPDDDVPSRLVGGSLKTLLYLAQLAAISMDPWFSRVNSLQMVDHIALDLDPMPGTSFETVLDVARWVHDELVRVGAVGFPKTSGADGLHVYIPMPKNTPYEAGRIWAQIVATMVATKHPKVATVERTVRKRGAKVYVDYLQNIEGKTLACAYSARASEYAGASTPLTLGRGASRRRSARLHDRHAAGAPEGGGRPVEAALQVEAAGSQARRETLAVGERPAGYCRPKSKRCTSCLAVPRCAAAGQDHDWVTLPIVRRPAQATRTGKARSRCPRDERERM